MEILATIPLGMISGIIAGIYSGLIVSRFIKFEELKNQINKAISEISYVAYSDGVEIEVPINTWKIKEIADDFDKLKHKQASQLTSELYMDSMEGFMPTKEALFEEKLAELRNWNKKLKPSYLALFDPRFRL